MESAPTKKPIPVDPAEPVDDHTWIMLRDIRLPIGYQLITLHRGEIVDDENLIKRIKECFTGRLPMRKISVNDLLDRGLL